MIQLAQFLYEYQETSNINQSAQINNNQSHLCTLPTPQYTFIFQYHSTRLITNNAVHTSFETYHVHVGNHSFQYVGPKIQSSTWLTMLIMRDLDVMQELHIYASQPIVPPHKQSTIMYVLCC